MFLTIFSSLLAFPILIAYYLIRRIWGFKFTLPNIFHLYFFYWLVAISIHTYVLHEGKSRNVKIINESIGTNFNIYDVNHHSEWSTGEEHGAESIFSVNELNEKKIIGFINRTDQSFRTASLKKDYDRDKISVLFKSDSSSSVVIYYNLNKKIVEFSEHTE